MRIEVVIAWPDRHEATCLELRDGATVADALDGWRDGTDNTYEEEIAGYAVFGIRALPGTVLRDGDRLELLRALQLDPKESRRRRAQKRETP